MEVEFDWFLTNLMALYYLQKTIITTCHILGFMFVCVEYWWFPAEILEDSPGRKCLERGLQ